MSSFRRKLLAGTPIEKHTNDRIHYTLAQASYESFKDGVDTSCRPLYCCLSHLAKIPELAVNIASFDELVFQPVDTCDPEIISYVERKLRECTCISTTLLI